MPYLKIFYLCVYVDEYFDKDFEVYFFVLHHDWPFKRKKFK